MKGLLKLLREARPEIIGSIIGGLVVAAVLAVVGKLTGIGIWPVIATVVACLWLVENEKAIADFKKVLELGSPPGGTTRGSLARKPGFLGPLVNGYFPNLS